jgi:hypothetical protein
MRKIMMHDPEKVFLRFSDKIMRRKVGTHPCKTELSAFFSSSWPSCSGFTC